MYTLWKKYENIHCLYTLYHAVNVQYKNYDKTDKENTNCWKKYKLQNGEQTILDREQQDKKGLNTQINEITKHQVFRISN